MGTLSGFPNPPALWLLRPAKPASANALCCGQDLEQFLPLAGRDDAACLHNNQTKLLGTGQ